MPATSVIEARSAPATVIDCSRCLELERRLARLSSLIADVDLDPSPIGPDGSSHRPAPGGVELTVREYQVGVLIAQGRSNAEIAAVLYIGVNSVKTHVKGLYRQLGVRNRTEAAIWFVRTGQVEPAGGPPPSAIGVTHRDGYEGNGRASGR